MGKIRIWCNSNKERDAVLKKMEEQGIVWINDEKPTKFTPVPKCPIGLYVSSDEKLVYGTRKDVFETNYKDYRKISVKDYLGKSKPKATHEIHITTDGTNTYGIMKENGKVIKRVVAKCSEEDEFVFEGGANLVLERLFNKEKVKGVITSGCGNGKGRLTIVNCNNEDLKQACIQILKSMRQDG